MNNLIEKSREGAPTGSKPMLPLVRIKVNQELLMAILSPKVVINIKEIEFFFRSITLGIQ